MSSRLTRGAYHGRTKNNEDDDEHVKTRGAKRPGRPPRAGRRGPGRPRKSLVKSDDYYYFDPSNSNQVLLEDTTETLVGRRIACFWEAEKAFYYGTILQFDGDKGRAFCHFDDGDEVSLDLRKEKWVLIDIPGQFVEREGSMVGQPPLETEFHPVMATDEYTVFPTSYGEYGFEIFMNRTNEKKYENPRIQCKKSGHVRIVEVLGQDEKPRVTEIQLPHRIRPDSAFAICSDSNQLYIRVSILG